MLLLPMTLTHHHVHLYTSSAALARPVRLQRLGDRVEQSHEGSIESSDQLVDDDIVRDQQHWHDGRVGSVLQVDERWPAVINTWT